MSKSKKILFENMNINVMYKAQKCYDRRNISVIVHYSLSYSQYKDQVALHKNNIVPFFMSIFFHVCLFSRLFHTA